MERQKFSETDHGKYVIERCTLIAQILAESRELSNIERIGILSSIQAAYFDMVWKKKELK